MNRISPASLALSLFLVSISAHAQTNTDPNREVNRMGAPSHDSQHDSETEHSEMAPPLPNFSGNLPNSVNEDRTHGVNAPGTLIGPSPENGQSDPRFPNDKATAGGGSEINSQSSSETSSQTTTGADKMSGAGQSGGTTSNLNEGLPSASKDNSGANSGDAGGTESNAGGDARPDVGASQSTDGSSDAGRETAGAAPFAIAGGAVIIGAFLFAVMRGRKRK